MSHTYALAMMQDAIAWGRWIDRRMSSQRIPGMPWARCVGTLRHTSGQHCGNLDDRGGNYLRAAGLA